MHLPTIRASLVALLLATAGLLAACGGDDGANSDAASEGVGSETTTAPSSGGEAAIIVAVKEFSFEPSDITVAAGEVEVTIDNKGVVEHDFSIEEAGIEVYAAAGGSTAETVTIDAGTYTFFCSIPGHRDAGMEGTLTAE